MSLSGNLSAEKIIIGSIGNIHITDKALQEIVNEITAQLIDNENVRQETFEFNEAQREAEFELNERLREASFNGEYTNLLKGAVDDTTLDLPTQFPCHKIGSCYGGGKFTADSLHECYLFEVNVGDRILVSNYVYTIFISEVISILDESFASLYYVKPSQVKGLLDGLYPMPENARYVAINTPSGSSVPNVTLVSEGVIKTNCVDVPSARKFVSPQYKDDYHLCYDGQVGSAITSTWGRDTSNRLYANGIYPLESGVEYVLHIPSLVDTEQYYRLAFLCDENFVVNRVVQQAPDVPWVDFDKNNSFVFTPSENDKYIVINTYDFASAQFGENKMKGVTKSVNIGNAVFDGKHDITLADMGVIDRSINKKFIAYGDSITLGVGIDYVNGEKRWTDYLVERYNIPEHINMGEGLTCISFVPTTDSYQGISMCRDERLNNLIAEAPDIVTIFGGANDYICDIPIGADDDIKNKNIYTFKGAYAHIIDKILTAKPDTLILLLGMFTNTMGVYAEGKGTYPLKDYATATKEIAEHFGLPFVDLNECGFNKYNFNTTDGVFSTDGIHPNAEGTKRIAMVVSKWFDTFMGTVY